MPSETQINFAKRLFAAKLRESDRVGEPLVKKFVKALGEIIESKNSPSVSVRERPLSVLSAALAQAGLSPDVFPNCEVYLTFVGEDVEVWENGATRKIPGSALETAPV